MCLVCFEPRRKNDEQPQRPPVVSPAPAASGQMSSQHDELPSLLQPAEGGELIEGECSFHTFSLVRRELNTIIE